MKYKNPNAVRGMMAALCMLGILFLSRPAVLAVNAEGDAKLTASAVVEEGKSTATVTVALEGNPGVWGLKFKVGYDHAALTLQSVEKGSVFEESDVVLPDSLDREQFVYVAASNKLENITADGNLATLNFLVKDGASLKSYPVTLELIQAINAEGKDVDITASIGEDVIEIRGLEESYPYTGAKITPDFDVVDKNVIVDGEPKVLTIGVDYTVKYTNNTKETTDENNKATVTVVGKGNYTGKDVTGSFRIEAVKDVSDENISGENIELLNLQGAKIDNINPIPYTGEKQYPDFILTLNDESKSKTVYEYDYNEKIYKTKDDAHTPIAANVALSNNVNKGTATVLITGAAGANGKATSVKKTFKINPVDLSQAGDKLMVTVAGVTADAAKVPYAVNGAAPEIKVSYKFSDDKDAAVLVNGRDYTLKYSSNKKAGTGKFTITGKGNYTKKYAGTGTFTIVPLDMAETRLVAVTAYSGLKAGKVKATVVDKNGDMLKASQYIVKVYKDGSEYTGKLETGDTISVKAVAKDIKNLEGGTETKPVEFTVGENIAKAKFVLNFKSKIYTGAEITLKESDFKSATIKIKGETSPRSLKLKPKNAASDAGYDFEIVSYSGNINKGTATAVIRGIGDYSGTKTIKFKITAKKMTPSIKKLLTDALQRLW